MALPVGFLAEANGNLSSMRLMSFCSLGAAIVFGLLTVLGKGGSDGITITIAFLTAAFGPKVIQKPFEKSVPAEGQAIGGTHA